MKANHRSVRLVIAVCALLIVCAYLPAQTPLPSPVTGVLTTLTVKNGVDRSQVMKVLPQEVRKTVKLYLDGKIQQWYARSDGKGVVFILACKSLDEAKAVTDQLPLSKSNLADFEYTLLSPLTPLRLLVAEPATTH